MTTYALALAGGGARGSWQAGALMAIVEKLLPSIKVVVGTSAGALNGAFWLGGSLDNLNKIWLEVKNKDIYSLHPWRLATPRACLYDTTPLRTNLQSYVDFQRLLNCKLPFYVNTTALDGHSVSTKICGADFMLSETIYALQAIMGSSAAPIAFPPVSVPIFDKGKAFVPTLKWCIDGGVCNDYGIATALEEQPVDHVIMVSPSLPNVYSEPKNVVDMIETVINLGENNYLQRDLQYATAKGVKVTIIRPDKPLPIGLLDFNALGSYDNRRAIISDGYRTATQAIKELN